MALVTTTEIACLDWLWRLLIARQVAFSFAQLFCSRHSVTIAKTCAVRSRTASSVRVRESWSVDMVQ